MKLALKNDPQLAQMETGFADGHGDQLYDDAFAAPAGSTKMPGNPLAKLSDDKKTVTMKFNLIDVFDHPDQFEYAVEY